MHEWGYRFNESTKIADLTITQRKMIALAEQAEAYIKQQQREQQQRAQNSPINTKTNIENRPSKQKRIQEAIQRQKN